MSVIFNKTGKLLVLVALLFGSHVSYSLAQQNEPLLNFKFNHLSNIPAGDLFSLQSPSISSDSLNFTQYDATWTYRTYIAETKNFNIDLGVTLRHLSGFKNLTENSGNTYFQKVLPLLHASALFTLPLEGLSAGIEGSRLDTSDRQVFDYRAKVSYEWRKGFGLQGGWQHQQFNLENAANSAADYKRNGPFLDFYLNF